MELVETGLMHKTTGVALGNKPLRQNLKKKKKTLPDHYCYT